MDIDITLRVINTYDGEEVVTTPTGKVPAPTRDDYADDDLEAWAQTHLFALTGTGKVVGDAFYDVTITACEMAPNLVGRVFDFGY